MEISVPKQKERTLDKNCGISPYALYLSTYTYPQLKQYLAGIWIANVDDVKKEVGRLLTSMAPEWFSAGLMKNSFPTNTVLNSRR